MQTLCTTCITVLALTWHVLAAFHKAWGLPVCHTDDGHVDEDDRHNGRVKIAMYHHLVAHPAQVQIDSG